MFLNKIFISIFCILFFYSTPGFSIRVESDYAYLVDYKTDQILFEKNSEKIIFPASMTHHTTPFNSSCDRVVLAFDVVGLSD